MRKWSGIRSLERLKTCLSVSAPLFRRLIIINSILIDTEIIVVRKRVCELVGMLVYRNMCATKSDTMQPLIFFIPPHVPSFHITFTISFFSITNPEYMEVFYLRYYAHRTQYIHSLHTIIYIYDEDSSTTIYSVGCWNHCLCSTFQKITFFVHI